jgi:hypothetical protein
VLRLAPAPATLGMPVMLTTGEEIGQNGPLLLTLGEGLSAACAASLMDERPEGAAMTGTLWPAAR